jgi:hypothetical protein
MDLVKDLTLGQNKITSDVLYRSLGSFWTQVFSEKGTIKGYTLGQAEELVQSYYKLADLLHSLSIKHIPVFSSVRWQPLIIQKSKYNKAPLKFVSSGAVFGAQPVNDRFYAKQVFRFGLPKAVNTPLYSYAPNFPLRKFNIITDRIIDPELILIKNVDILTDRENVLYFNKNIFELPYLPKAYVVNTDGEISTFVNSDGEVEDDTFVILWIYHAEIDEENIHNHFGKLFDVRLESSEEYRKLLEAVFDLFAQGPTINNIKAALGAFSGVAPTKHPVEKVKDIYADNLHRYVITDLAVYKFKPYQTVLPHIRPGSVIHAGELLVDVVEYFDVVTTPNWWEKELNSPKLGLSSHIFLGNYKQQLFFKTSPELVTYNQAGEIVFPVEGYPGDVEQFNQYLNHPTRKEQLKTVFNLKEPGNVAVIQPVDFIFTHFLKNCTALIKLNFNSTEEISDFFNLLPMIKQYLPAHVYLLFYTNVNVTYEEYDRLNSGYSLSDYPNVQLSLDGSTRDGLRPTFGGVDAGYFKEYVRRLFCVSVSPLAFNETPLHKEVNLDEFYLMSSGAGQTGQPRAVEGKVFTHIPNSLETTNREIPTVLIIDFS